MKGKYPNGLAKLFAQRGVNRAALARALKTAPQNVDRWHSQERKLTADWAQAIANQLGVTASEVMFEHQDDVISVPLVSAVSAGQLEEMIDKQDYDTGATVSVSGLDSSKTWIALEVDGDSMDRISPPGSVICVDTTDKKLVPNACYVIADEEGGATYKRFRPDPDRFEPVSVNTEHSTLYFGSETSPMIIGRVRRSILSM